jgi:hypothetical protein
VNAERGGEEVSGCSGIASGRDVDVDDLTVLVDRPVDVPPPARDLHVGLVHEPAITDCVAARPGRVCEQRREALYPPEHRHMIDLHPAFDQQLLDIAVREPEPQVPPHREDDDLRGEPEPGERRTRDCGYRTTMRSKHPTTVAPGHVHDPMQQSLS